MSLIIPGFTCDDRPPGPAPSAAHLIEIGQIQSIKLKPPDLTGWQAWCQSCSTHREVNCMEERDQRNGEVYYDYVCSACFTIVLNIHRSNPMERQRMPPQTSIN